MVLLAVKSLFYPLILNMNPAHLHSMVYGLMVVTMVMEHRLGAQDFGGYYLTAGYTLWQGNGKFAESSITPFVRYSVYDTAENEGGDYERTQVTYGVHMPLSEQVCLKLDYQDNSGNGSSVASSDHG